MWAVEAYRPFEVEGMALTGVVAQIDRGEEVDIVPEVEAGLPLRFARCMGVLHA